MENVSACRHRLEALRCRLAEQNDAAEADYLSRRDQARRLRDLRCQVTQEVEYVQHKESVAAYTFSQSKLISGLVNFGLGALGAALAGSRKHPLSVGAQMAKSEFERRQPYGTVLVAVRRNGVHDEVHVISLSRLARESGRPEAEVKAVLEAQGYLLMTPKTFSRVMDGLEDGVLSGTRALPVGSASLLLKSGEEGSK